MEFGSIVLNATCDHPQNAPCEGTNWSLTTPTIDTRLTYPIVITYLTLNNATSYCAFNDLIIPTIGTLPLNC